MARFYFDIRYDDEPWSPDEDGMELISRQLARAEALDLIGELAKDEVQQHQLIAVGVRDHGSDHFLEVVLSITVQPPD